MRGRTNEEAIRRWAGKSLAGRPGRARPLDGRLIAAYAVDTYALLGLLGAEEFADQELVNRGLQGLDDCLQRLRD